MREADAELSPRARFELAAAAGQLIFQRDPETGAAVFPPRLVAPLSGARSLAWEISRGVGTVHASTAVHKRGAVSALALVDLDEGFRMLATVVGVPASTVRIGMRVVLAMQEGSDGPYPAFAPEEGTSA